MTDDWKTEIEELHRFFEEWLGGTLPGGEEAFGRLELALDPTFTMVPPSGALLERAAVVDAVRQAWGTRPGLDIGIEEPRLVHSAGDLLLAAYVERQRDATGENARRSTTLFRQREAAPGGLSWLHVHETWMEGGR